MSSWRIVAPPVTESVDGRGAVPTFSVIVPAYQAAATIGDALDSAFAQTMQPVEVIVCDDGSTDDLDAALEPYRDKILLVRKENGGEGSAKDAAARAASGDFVVVLDADDAFLPQRIEALAFLAVERPDLGILTTDAFLESEGNVIRRAYTPDWSFESTDQRQAILQRNFIFSAAAIRRERLLSIGGFDPSARYAADWELWVRLILAGSRAGLVDEPLYRYRIGPGALSANRPKLVRGFLNALDTASSFELSSDERRILEHSRSERRRELALLELRAALDHRSGIRRAALRVVGARGLPLRVRLKAVLALLAPRLAATLRRQPTGWIGAGGTLVGPPRRVTLVAYTDATEVGGAEVSLGNLLAALPAQYAVVVIGVDSATVEAVASRRAASVRRVVPRVQRKHEVLRIVRHIAVLVRERPTIVHVSLNTPWACRYGIAAGLLTPGAHVVLVEQSLFPTDSPLQRAFKKFVSRHVDAHVAVGRKSAREIERLSNLPAGSVRTIYNGVEDRGARPPRGERSIPVVGAVGRLDHVKGHDVLLEAIALLPGVELLLVGDGPERAALEDRARRLGLSDRLTITGWVTDPSAQLSAMDVVALPSRLESFPLAVCEAMLAERAVVASDVGSVSEAVVDGETGTLVPSEDPQALARAIRTLLDDPVLRRRLAAGGRRRALELFTSEAMAASFTSLYEELAPTRQVRVGGS